MGSYSIVHNLFKISISFRNLIIFLGSKEPNRLNISTQWPKGLVCAYLLHSKSTWLIVMAQWHILHNGGASRLSKYSWVRRECPIFSLQYVISSFLLLNIGVDELAIIGTILYSLLSVCFSQWICQLFWIYERISGLKSWYGIGMLVIFNSNEVFA